MTLTFDIPAAVEQQLRSQTSDLDVEAKEAMLVGFYRQGKLTRRQLAESLGLTRLEIDAVLKKHHVTEDLPSLEELEDDLRQGATLVRR